MLLDEMLQDIILEKISAYCGDQIFTKKSYWNKTKQCVYISWNHAQIHKNLAE